jgi:hypothetical protein
MTNCAAGVPPYMLGTLSEGMRCRPAILIARRHYIILMIGTFHAELKLRSARIGTAVLIQCR